MSSPEPADDRTQFSAAPARKVGGGRFLLKQLLGRGAMGEVWLAEDTRLNERVALKFVASTLQSDRQAMESLRREVRRSRLLTHPGIVRIHDLHELPGEVPFISMEFIEGKTLSELRWSEPKKCLSWEKLQPLVRQLCEALEYAHGEGVVHRDLKPANLMVDARGRLKLADFGLATVVNESLSRASGHLILGGTPAYMSPQQMTGKPPTIADDIYSLGVTLYELLASHPPFYLGDIAYQTVNEPPPSLKTRQAEFQIHTLLPAPVEPTVMACLEKDPSLRPPTVRNVWEHLTVTVPVTRLPAIRRGRKALWAVAGALPLLVAAAGVFIFHHSGSNLGAVSSVKSVETAPDTMEPDGATGFKKIFNGKDLTGWTGDTNVWSVKDGCLLAQFPGSTNWDTSGLGWHEAGLENFELRFDWHWDTPRGSGWICYREQPDVLGRWDCPYRTGLHNYNKDNDCFCWFGLPRLRPGERLVVTQDGKQIRTGDAFSGYRGFGDLGNENEWIEMKVLVQGGHYRCEVNGHLLCEIEDALWQTRPRGERLALVACKDGHSLESASIRFRNLRLKKLLPE